MDDTPPSEAALLLARLPGMAYRSGPSPERPLIAVSDGAEAVTGRSPASLAGNARLADLVHPDDRDRVRRRVAESMASGRPFEIVYRIRRTDGTTIFVSDHGAPVNDPDGNAGVLEIAGFLSDAALQAEEQRWLRRTHEAIVAMARDPSLSDGDVPAFARRITRTAAEVLDVPRSGLWFLSEDRTRLELAALYLRDSGSHAEGAVIHAADFPAYFAALATGRAIAADDAATDPRTREFAGTYLREFDIRSMLDSTIRLGGEVVGVLCNEQVGIPRQWELHEISFAGELADQMAQALANHERREAEREALRAEHRSAAKSRFLATMSHEIRTPMSGILGTADLLAGTPLNDEQENLVSIIRESGDLLLGIINDILDFARIEADKLSLNEKPVVVAELARGATRLLDVAAAEKRITLRTEVAPEVPDRCLADERRLKQILLNLLANALKFTVDGSVTLGVTIDADPQRPAAPPRLRFTVTDTGIGIEPGEIESLFEPFEQASNQLERRPGGTGLGLAISRRLAELMGGTLTAESTPGQGSSFNLALPLRVPGSGAGSPPGEEPAHPNESEGESHASGFGSLHVLIAEDNAVNRRVIEAMLRRLGVEPVVCSNGRDALDAIDKAAQPFDLILMDCEMPVLSGLDAVRMLRGSDGPHRRTPVVALTAHALPESHELARDAGMDDCLTKPLSLETVTAVLERVARGWETGSQP